MNRIAVLLFSSCLAAGILNAGEKALMHCFAFTPIETATPADWDAFYKATDKLSGDIPGLSRVWAGKLRNKLRAGDAIRSYGVCMEFKDEAALKAYAANPAHKQWLAAYEKVRQPGTTTFDILGQ